MVAIDVNEHALPYTMPRLMLQFAVLFCVRSINFQPTASSTDRTRPYDRKLDMRRDLRIASHHASNLQHDSGAFNANMADIGVTVRLRKELASILCEMEVTYNDYVEPSTDA
jgi:hypothetical protein